MSPLEGRQDGTRKKPSYAPSIVIPLIFWLGEPAESEEGGGGSRQQLPLRASKGRRKGSENTRLSGRASQAARENTFPISVSTH